MESQSPLMEREVADELRPMRAPRTKRRLWPPKERRKLAVQTCVKTNVEERIRMILKGSAIIEQMHLP